MGFSLGSLPFSLWIGRWLLGQDIRRVGDGNPGATNVLRAGGRGAAGLALLLDVVKGALPVGMAYLGAGITNAWLIPIALAPIAGHAFSPLLSGRGGKAVATSLGIWAGLTAWEGPTVGGLALLVGARLLGSNGRAVVFALMVMLTYFLLTPSTWNGMLARPPLEQLLPIWLGNLLVIVWKHRTDLHSHLSG
jgi:glycerol-3-phosphate acyltransferase PlsY